ALRPETSQEHTLRAALRPIGSGNRGARLPEPPPSIRHLPPAFSSMSVFLSIDLGAGSGRVIAAETDLSSLRLEEIHRFDNPGTDLPGGSYWNIVGLFRDIQEGLRRAVGKYGDAIVSIGIDTWGCDFGLLDARGRLLGMPHQYRDSRHEGMPAV